MKIKTVVWTVIAAAGVGKRIGKRNKMFIPIIERPLIAHTIEVFEKCDVIDRIVVVALKNQIHDYEKIVKKFCFNKVKSIVPGGKKRQDSVFKGLIEMKRLGAEDDDIVVIHNGANPLVKEEEIKACVNAARKFGASAVGFPSKDTVKIVDEDFFVIKTLDRNDVWIMQTPQVMKFDIAMQAFEKALNDNFYGTDDVQLVERIEQKVKIIQCSYENIKVTTPEDVILVEGVLMNRMNKKMKKIKKNMKRG